MECGPFLGLPGSRRTTEMCIKGKNRYQLVNKIVQTMNITEPPPDNVSSKPPSPPRFNGVVIGAIIVAAFVGQAIGLVSVLRYSSQIDAKQVRAQTLDAEVARLGAVVE